MAAGEFVMSVIGANGSCCPCAHQVGCQCQDVPCGIQCEQKDGTAQLCGQPELENPDGPSVPPKFYKDLDIDGDMTVCKKQASDCSEPACPAAVSISGTQSFEGGPHSYAGTLEPVSGPSGGFIGYKATCSISPQDRACRMIIGYGGSTIEAFANGQTRTVLYATHDLTAEWQVFSVLAGNWVTIDLKCLNMGAAIYNSYKDTWAFSQHFEVPSCVAVPANSSTRQQQLGGACPPSGGSTFDLPIETSLEYPGATIVKSRTSWVVTGNGICAPDGAGANLNTDGEVIEQLSSEDTEDAAISRAEALLVWVVSLLGCGQAKAFRTLRGPGQTVMGFRNVRVQGNFARGVPGSSYRVTIRFFREVLGSPTSAAYYTEAHQDIVANSLGYGVTSKLDVPNEAGFATWAQNCFVTKTP
jgi:hypothetical protein